jgi:hypothetical protein
MGEILVDRICQLSGLISPCRKSKLFL